MLLIVECLMLLIVECFVTDSREREVRVHQSEVKVHQNASRMHELNSFTAQNVLQDNTFQCFCVVGYDHR